ncbi:sigma-E processing peptidase SpoIIGA [Paenibacillus marinisediminis]
MTVVYADLVLGLNVILDGTLLYLTARMRGIQLAKWRWIGSTAIGTAYAGLLFLPIVPQMLTLVGKVLISICMLIVAFGYQHLGYLLRNMLFFYFNAFVIAGGAFGVQYLLHDASSWSIISNQSEWHISQEMKMGAGIMLLALLAAMLCYRLVWKQQQSRKQMESFLADIEIGIGGMTRSCRGLIDTGNGLKEPLSGAPVVITNADMWKGVLPERWLRCSLEGTSWDALTQLTGAEAAGAETYSSSTIDDARLRLLPYRGVNAKTQWMIGFKPDYIQIIHNSHTYVCKQVIIGLDSGQLSRDEQFEAIIHPDLIAASLQKPEDSAPSASKAS